MYRVPADYAYFTAESKEMPPYPPEALNNNIGGDVILVVEYSTKGSVEAVQGVRGDPALLTVSSETVRNWKFRPIQEKGQKVRGVAYVGFHFVPTTNTVTSSLPFGKWEPEPPPSGAAPDPARRPLRVRISSGVVASNKLAGSNPKYPVSAKHDHIQGEVLLRTLIGNDGHISLLEVTKAPSTDLGISAVEAVKDWQYKPYLLNGDPVEVETTIQVNYTLSW